MLHVATTGVHWTDDAGVTWHRLVFKGMKGNCRSHYYPRSVQAKDGRIHVFSHNGGDDAYGEYDQSIIMDTFRLTGG